MDVVNITEAKTRFLQLVDKAAAGEDVIISRHGRPVARIARLGEARPTGSVTTNPAASATYETRAGSPQHCRPLELPGVRPGWNDDGLHPRNPGMRRSPDRAP
jgi:antitoxin (DNA-binding transcriptional repressor) of toxin-antitoxin stability system